jgi:hypothetical protein
MSRTRAVCRESWIIGRTHDGNDARIVIQPLSGLLGVALHCACAKVGGHMVNQVFDKGDYLKVRRAHQQLAPAIAATVGCLRSAYLRNTLFVFISAWRRLLLVHASVKRRRIMPADISARFRHGHGRFSVQCFLRKHLLVAKSDHCTVQPSQM